MQFARVRPAWRWWLPLLLAATGCATRPTGSAEPLNLSVAKAAVIAYHDSGVYAQAVAAVAAEAEAWMARRASAARPDERLAVVFDIDETMLSNFPHLVSQDFGYVPPVWIDWVERAEAPVLPAVRQVYETARRLGVAVFFVTGRKDPLERAGTEENLLRHGLHDYVRLDLAAANDPRPTAVRKAARRAAIEAEGYTIIANLGDQESDLAGGYAERVFKLPNPFYLIP